MSLLESVRRSLLTLPALALVWTIAAAEAMAQESDAVFVDTEFNTVELTMSPGDWSALCDTPLDRTWRHAQFKWKGETYNDVAVRPAGHLTAHHPGPKPGLRVDFDQFVAGQKFHGMPNIKLDGLMQDPDLIRERIAYKVYRDFGIPTARYVHIRLYVNGSYIGVYGLEERINKTFVTRVWGGTPNQVYEYDRDGSGDTEFTWRGADPTLYVPLPWEPKTETTPDQADWVRDLINTVNNNTAAAASVFDVDHFIKVMAVETVLGNWDGYCAFPHDRPQDVWTNNLYLYRNPQNSRFLLIPWDPTLTSNLWGFYPWNRPIAEGFQNRVFTKKLILDNPANFDRFKQRIGELLNGVYDVARQQAYIDFVTNQIAAAAAQDTNKGTVGIGGWPPRAWVKDRSDYLRSVLGTIPTPTSNNSAYVSQNVPSSMTAGQTYTVSVTMRNTGTSTWLQGGYTLGSQSVPDMNWGMNRVALGAAQVDPNGTTTFTWDVTAPATPGTYDFRWQMRQSGVEWFGPLTPNVAVNVTTSTATVNNATFVSQTVPAAMVAGQQYQVSVRMRNSGTSTWTEVETYRLRSQNPMRNMTWGSDTVSLSAGESIAPNQEKNFTWTVTAPASAGTYSFQWQMRQSSTDHWFGDLSPNVAVTVTSTTSVVNLAAFVSQNAPLSMTAGTDYTVTVTMRNSGTSTWTEGGQYRLSSRGPRDNTTWAINRVYLAPGDSIAPGQSHTFTFDVTAPSTAGSHTMQWSMVQDGVDWFPDVTPMLTIAVGGGGPGPAPAGVGDNRNGNGGLWPNDKCSGSIGGVSSYWMLTIAACFLAAMGCSKVNENDRRFR